MAGIVFAVGLALAWQAIRSEAHERFNDRFARSTRELSRNARDVEGFTLGLRGLFHALDKVAGDQFRAFAADGLERHEFLREVAYYPRIPGSARSTAQSDHPEFGFGAGIVDGVTIAEKRIHGVAAKRREVHFPLLYRDLRSEDRMIPGLDLAGLAHDEIVEASQNGGVVVGKPRSAFDDALVIDVFVATYSTKRVPAQSSDRVQSVDGIIGVTVDVARLLGHGSAARADAPPLRGLPAIEAVVRGLDRSSVALPPVPVADGAYGGLDWARGEGTPITIARFGTAASDAELQGRETIPALGGHFEFVWNESSEPRAAQLAVWIPLMSGLCLAGLVLGLGRAASRLRGMNSALEGRNVELQRLQGELQASIAEVERINGGLEDLVRARTESLDVVNRDLRQVLDNIAAGVLTVDADLRVRAPLSPAFVATYGGGELIDRDLAAVLFPDGSAPRDALRRHRAALDLLKRSDEMQWELCSDDLLTTVTATTADGTHATRAIKYAPVFDTTGAIERIVIVVDDITSLLRLENIEEQRRVRNKEEAALLQNLVSIDPARLGGFLKRAVATADFVMQVIDEPSSPDDEIRRECLFRLHTMKGTARAHELSDVASLVHDVETQVQFQSTSGGTSSSLTKLRALLTEYQRIARVYLLGGVDAARRAAAGIAARRIQLVCGEGLAAAVEAEVRGDLLSVRTAFEELSTVTDRLAYRLGKRVEYGGVGASAADVLVPSDVGDAIRDAMVHAVTNAVDHGIETPDARRRLGKPDNGRIWLDIDISADGVELRIADDGRGIDSSVGGDDDVEVEVSRVFEAGVSTAATVTAISGRGVGLSAARRELVRVGATVFMTSQRGKGATLHVVVPSDRVGYVIESGVPRRLGDAGHEQSSGAAA